MLPSRRIAFGVGAAGLLILATVWTLQLGFRYAPCPLCLEQRWGYYAGAPLALVLGALAPKLPRPLLAIGLVAVAGLFLWSAGIGVYQAGAEWGAWLGPANCSAGNQGATPASVGDLMAAIRESVVVSCTDPQLRVLGLSLAGCNAIAAGVLGLLGLWAAWLAAARRPLGAEPRLRGA